MANFMAKNNVYSTGERDVRVWRARLLLAVAMWFGVTLQAQANPFGAQVISGAANINQTSNTLTVANSPNAIINWQGFSIGQGETTRFVQQNANSAVLNRVIGADPSQLLGTLSSNGRVFLVNPSGILVGQGARIDVAGLVASTLNLSDADFLSNNYNFTPTLNAAGVLNAGSITTPDGGTVYLIAPQVENRGLITTPKGETILAAGNAVQLIDTATPGVSVQIAGSGNNAVNVGRILADSGRIGMVGAMVRNSGELNASSLVSQGGRVFLKASQDTYVDRDATIVGTGSTGGNIEVLGNRVAVTDNASLDASGQSGGGTVLVGGDYQGKNPDVQNASVSYLGPQASIKADAITNGDGGKVIVWADDTTRFYGSISARGGVNGGDGGFVEVSGKGQLDFRGNVDTRAPLGTFGTLLLDPTNIVVQAANPDIAGNTTGLDIQLAADLSNSANYGAVTSIITGTALGNLVDTANVTLAATNDITVNDVVTWGTSTFALTLNAGNNISINAALDSIGTAGGDITLVAGNAISLAANLVSTFNTAPQGLVTLTAGAGGINQSAGAITASSLKVTSGGGVTLNGANDLGVIAGSVSGSGFQYSDANGFSVGAVGGITGLTLASGNIALSTGAQDSLLTIGQNVQATAGSVSYKTDNLAHNAFTTTSGSAGSLVEITPFTPATNIEFSAAADAAGTLRLSSSELNFSTPLLRVGNAAMTGNIAIAESVAPASFPSLSLITGGTISQQATTTISTSALSAKGFSVNLPEANPVGVISGATTGGDFIYNTINQLTVSNVAGVNGISVPDTFNIRLSSNVGINQNAGSVIKANGASGGGLALITAGPVFLDQANDVRTIAASLTGAGNGFMFVNSENVVAGTVGDLVVGSLAVGGITTTGITTNGGDINLDTPGLLTVLNPIAAGAGRVGLFADDLILSNTVTSTSEVGISPYSAGITITVGAACGAGCLSVSNLWQVNAPTIGIGEDGSLGGGGLANPVAGAISVAGITTGGATATDRHANTTRIGLFSGAGITQTGIINVQDLGLSAETGVTLTGANMVSNLAGKTTTGPFQFTNAQTFNIAVLSGGSGFSAYSMPGIQALSGDVLLTATGATSDIVANSPQNYSAIIANNGNVTLNAGRDVLIGNSGGTFADIYAYGAAKNASITAARHILVDNFSFVLSEAGDVSLTATGGNVSIRSSVNGSGSWIGAGTAGTGGIVTISAPAGFVLAPAPGYGGDVGGGHISTGTGGELVVTAYNGITLNGLNTVAGFNASNGIAGDVILNNTSSPLNIVSVLNPSGVVAVTNFGAITVGIDGISAGGAVALTSGSAGSSTASDIITINGPVTGSSVTLAANSVAGTIPAGATVLTYTAPPPPPPTVDQCVVDPTIVGCTAVLPPLADCTLNPTLAGCTAVLPPLADCTLNPTLAGCTAVLPPLADCTLNPTLAGCTAVLPPLADCALNPTLTGCTAVLPPLADCALNPTLAGCTAVLPPLADCTLNPALAGCAAVLPTVATCIQTPNAQGCTAVLPVVTACLATPTLPGCAAVQVVVAACTATPTLPGCALVLPVAVAPAQTAIQQQTSNVLNSTTAASNPDSGSSPNTLPVVNVPVPTNLPVGGTLSGTQGPVTFGPQGGGTGGGLDQFAGPSSGSTGTSGGSGGQTTGSDQNGQENNGNNSSTPTNEEEQDDDATPPAAVPAPAAC